MDRSSSDMPYVIFRLIEDQFAVSTKYIREMIAVPKVVSVPQTPDYIRGVINIRGQVFPLLDLRVKLGMTSLEEEKTSLVRLLDRREQDHSAWIEELETSVHERREFLLATDPHQCPFGKWYDNFTTDHRILANCLKKFDAPHKKIHGIAFQVKLYEENEDFESAYNLISRTRENELNKMVELFAEARSLLLEYNREIAIVLKSDTRAMALVVDSVETIEKLPEADIERLPFAMHTNGNDCLAGIGKRSKGDTIVQLLAAENLLGDLGGFDCRDTLISPPR